MNRDALVVGINQYPFLKDTPTSKAKNLKSPASSAEAIALRLEKYGGFRVRRLPETIQEEQRYVDPESVKLDADILENAIVQLFNPVGDNSPETALLYFIGHGLRKERGGVTEGFLATSDVNPRKKRWGVSLRWLRELLQRSPVRQQIVWLDCCFAGELLNFTEADLGTASQGQTRFLIAAAREFELAEEDVQGQYGAFSRILWQGLDPRRQPQGVVNNDRLIEYIDQTLKGFPHQPIWYNPHREIILTGAREQVFVATPDGICPYKGLRFFDVGDAPYFYGREALTQKLIERVQVSKGNFLAVLGVSGSGKSSLLRAGLMYQLQEERRLPGTEQWKIRIFTPGEQPLVSLATAFLDEEITDIERAGQLRKAEAAIKEGATGLARLIRASKSPRTVLIVDQFEEVFTPSVKANNRQQFISSLLGALKQTGDKLCLILAMRDDFLGKCAAYRELADLIQANLVMVTPMSAQELRLAIVEPATKLGRKVEVNLINAILKDLGVKVQYSEAGEQISEPEPGMLPLLEYTLEQLWQRQVLNWLKLDSYNQLGGVHKTLENLAEQAYKDLSVEEQRVADQIFIKLTQLGEGTPDTRKQVPQQDLVTQSQSAELVEQVIQKLAQAKLIVTSEQRKGQEKIAVVDVAHEALIRYWSRLRELLDNNREAIRTERKIQTAAQEWREKEKSKDYLLTGLRLGEVETFLQDEADIVPLSSLAKEFIQESQEERDRLIKEEEERQQRELRQAKALTEEQSRRTRNARQALSIVALLLVIVTGVAIYANSQRIKAQEEGDRANRESRIAQARELATISLGIPDRKTDLRLLLAVKSVNLTKDTKRSVLPEAEIALYRALTQSTLRGEFIEDDQASDFGGWTWPVTYNKSSKQLVVPSARGSTILLDDKGVKIATLTDKDLPYTNDYGATFSPDGNTIFTAGNDGNVRFWNLKGELLRRYQAHSNDILSVQVTLDYILTVGCDDTDVSYYRDCKSRSARLWNNDGSFIVSLKDNESLITSAVFNSDGTRILTASEDRVVRLWDTSGKLLFDFSNSSSWVHPGSFNPDGKHIVVAEGCHPWFDASMFSPLVPGLCGYWHSHEGTNQAKVLNENGEVLATLPGYLASFSPEGKHIITADNDGAVYLWDVNGNPIRSWKTRNGIVDINFSPNGLFITVAHRDTVTFGNIESKLLTTLEGFISLTSARFNSDGTRVATVSCPNAHQGYCIERNIQIWDMDGSLLTSRQYSSDINPNFYQSPYRTNPLIKYSPSGQYILTANNDGSKPQILHTTNMNIVSTLAEQTDVVHDVIFSSDDKYILTVSEKNEEQTSEETSIKLWNIDGNLIKNIANFDYDKNGNLNSFAISNDGNLVAVGDTNGRVTVWNKNSNLNSKISEHEHSIDNIIFSHNTNKIAIIDSQGITSVWDEQLKLVSKINAGALINKDHQKYHNNFDNKYKVVFVKNEKQLLIANPTNIGLWDTNGKLHWSVDIDTLDYSEIDVSDNHFLVIACTQRGKGMSVGSLATCYNSLAQLWDFNGNLISSLDSRTEGEDIVEYAKFNFQGNRIITIHKDEAMRLWDNQGNFILKLEGKGASGDFHPDGTRLATVDKSGELKIYEIWSDLESMINEARRRAGRNLTEKECQDYLHQDNCRKTSD